MEEKIINCNVNHQVNPIGYGIKTPVFSWVECSDQVESERICIYQWSKAGNQLVADTGWKNLNPRATKVPLELLPRTRYIWKVQMKEKDGTTYESKEQFFETGKLSEPWQGKWITTTKSENESERLPIFKKEISLNIHKKLHHARLYICGLGLYEAYLNGTKIGEDYFTPGFYAYDQWLQAQTYDITECLSSKETQMFSVLLGEGWYMGRYNFESPDRECYGDSYKVIAEIHLTYEDGEEEVIATDESWNVERSKVLFTGIYDGEWQDDTLLPLPEEKVVLVEQVQKGEKNYLPPIQDSLSVPVREQEQFTPKLIQTPAGETVLDLGQNMAGIFHLRVKEPAGTKLHLQFGEVLQESNFYRENLRTAKAEFRYVSDGRERIVRPHFTYYGYRYVKLEGFTNFQVEDFIGVALYSDLLSCETMETGNAKVNQLISNTIWGMKSNFIDVPTDCPQRDERKGWTGDAQVFSETACYLADTYAFYRKYLYDMSKEQQARDGMVPDIVPAPGYDRTAAVWGDATCIIPWNLYLFYGDQTILEEHYESMKAWISYIQRIDGNHHGWREVFQYGDWLALDSPYPGESQTHGGTDEGFIADAYYRKSVLIVAKTAHILGKLEEEKKYVKLAETILRGIQEEYYSAAGRCCVNTQTAALLTLQEDLHNKDRAKAQLKNLLEYKDDHLATGFVGTPLLCPTLTEYGMTDKAFKLLLNEEYPGWLYEVNLGATTIWERWNSLDPTGTITGTRMNSFNHYSYGAIVSWLWNGVAGIKPLEEAPGFIKVKIAPHVNWKLNYLNATYRSPAGQYEIQWKVNDFTHIYLKVVVPKGCTAEVIPPLMKEPETYWLTGETLEITYETKEPLAKALSAEEPLGVLMAVPEARDYLHMMLDEVDELASYTRQYPLKETLTNLHYKESLIQTIDQRLQEIYI